MISICHHVFGKYFIFTFQSRNQRLKKKIIEMDFCFPNLTMKKYLLPLFMLLACERNEVKPPEPIHPIPSERQLTWHELEYYGFVHFNMNTFSDMEWGMGDESLYNLIQPNWIPGNGQK
jgi:hypothetical protein